jgi:hypothetical protein
MGHSSWTSPGVGVSPSDNDDGQPTSLKIFVVSMVTLSIYNAIELAIIVFLTFKHYSGLYFWSLLISGLAIIPYSVGFLLNDLEFVTGDGRWFAATLIAIGWWPMVTGQAVVLWSRLHLIVLGARGDKIIRWTGWMIVIDAILFHIPTTVFTYGSNVSHEHTATVFATGYNVMEKIQMTGFVCQEAVLSTIYIIETMRMLRTSLKPHTRRTVKQLVLVNAFIIAMDLGLLALEAASLYILETTLKGVVYAIKLKLEFAILSKLVKCAGGGGRHCPQDGNLSHGFDPNWSRNNRDCEGQTMDVDDIREFVDVTRISDSISNPSRSHSRRKDSTGIDLVDLARFQHVEDASIHVA